MSLPEFDGSYEKWSAFHDTFKTIIHEHRQITTIQKFQYLRSALTGDAAQVMQGLEISAANYDAAWELLTKRYQNKTLNIHNHIKGIVEHPKLNKANFQSLRNLLNSIQGHLRSLKSLEEDYEQWGSLLIYIIADKFDTRTRTEWEKKIDRKKMPAVFELVDFIEEQCLFLEKTDKSAKDSIDQSRFRPSKPLASKPYNTFSHAATDQPTCPVRDGSHPIYTCQRLQAMPVKSRIAEIKKHKRCLNCFRTGHFSPNCQSRPCLKCKELHHTLLHREKI